MKGRLMYQVIHAIILAGYVYYRSYDYLPEWAGQKVKIQFDPLKHLLIILSVFKVI